MKLGNVVGAVPAKGVKSLYKSASPKPQSQACRSVREEVVARRKRQKDFDLINIIKTNIETRLTEKLKDILGIRF